MCQHLVGPDINVGKHAMECLGLSVARRSQRAPANERESGSRGDPRIAGIQRSPGRRWFSQENTRPLHSPTRPLALHASRRVPRCVSLQFLCQGPEGGSSVATEPTSHPAIQHIHISISIYPAPYIQIHIHIHIHIYFDLLVETLCG